MEVYLWSLGLMAVAIPVGYALFFLVLTMLPYLEKRENLIQKKELLAEAKRQCSTILANAKIQLGENELLMREELEALIQQAQDNLRSEDEELGVQEERLDADNDKPYRTQAAVDLQAQ